MITNDSSLSARQVLEAHKRQPVLEKRFEQLKTVHEIAPVCLKSETRIEAFFFLYFLALLMQALIERELRVAMRRQGIESLPLYPEERHSRRPTTEQIFRLFSHVEGHVLTKGERAVDVVQPTLTSLQQQVLNLLGVPKSSYRITI